MWEAGNRGLNMLFSRVSSSHSQSKFLRHCFSSMLLSCEVNEDVVTHCNSVKLTSPLGKHVFKICFNSTTPHPTLTSTLTLPKKENDCHSRRICKANLIFGSSHFLFLLVVSLCFPLQALQLFAQGLGKTLSLLCQHLKCANFSVKFLRGRPAFENKLNREEQLMQRKNCRPSHRL